MLSAQSPSHIHTHTTKHTHTDNWPDSWSGRRVTPATEHSTAHNKDPWDMEEGIGIPARLTNTRPRYVCIDAPAEWSAPSAAKVPQPFPPHHRRHTLWLMDLIMLWHCNEVKMISFVRGKLQELRRFLLFTPSSGRWQRVSRDDNIWRLSEAARD